MFIPFASLYFVIKDWEATKAPFLAGLGGGALMMFGGEKCKKRPANVYRIPRTVALMQGMPEAQCR